MKKNVSHKHRYIPAAILVILIIAGATGFIVRDKNKKISTPSNSTTTSGVVTKAPNMPINSTEPIVTNSNPSSPTAPPQSPSGSFVSTTSATYNGQEQSYCNTTAGASCVIKFTSGDITKNLPAMTATTSVKNDQVAFATWSWSPNQIGLNPGSWNVSATATLNGQSTTTQSTVVLQVNP